MAKKYSFTDHPEHEAKLADHHEKWLRVPLDCTPMTDDDRAACAHAVREMYALAKIPGSPRVVFVASPFVAQFAAGFAAAIWHRRAATGSATKAATEAATDAATYAATDAAVSSATADATAAEFLLSCAAKAWRIRNGGNQWSGWVEMVTFFRDVAQISIDFAPLAPYESLAKLSGPRYTHEKFCIISDKPEYIKGYWRDGRFVAHCEDGPSHRWSDGSCIYTWHGRQLGWRFGSRSGGNPDIIDHPETITVAAIQSESNAEIRRVMIARFGAARYARESGAKLLHKDEFGKVWRTERPGDTPIVMLECVNGTPEPIDYAPGDGESGEWVGNRWHKHYWLRVPPTIQTARAAEAWIHGLDHAEQYAPQVRT